MAPARTPREPGIDLSDRRPQRLSRELAQQADVVVTMGCGNACPFILGKRHLDCELLDPKGRPVKRRTPHAGRGAHR